MNSYFSIGKFRTTSNSSGLKMLNISNEDGLFLISVAKQSTLQRATTI